MKIAFFIFVSGIIFFSCKKDTAPKPEDPEEHPTYYSKFSLADSHLVNNQSLQFISRKPGVWFYKRYPEIKGPYYTALDSVILNSTPLKVIHDIYYTWCSGDTLPRTLTPPFNWRFKSSDFPSFSWSTTDSFPRFTKYHLLPDSIDISDTTTIQLQNFNADKVFVGLSYDPNLSGWGTISDGTVNSVQIISPSVSITPNATLTVRCYKERSFGVEGNTVYFTISSSYIKKVKIVP